MGRSFQVVILGGGTAAGYAALEFVKNDYNHGDLCIISEESVAPYERPALSKGFLLPEGAARLPSFHTCVGTGNERQLTKWYKDHGIELILDTRVVAADVKGHTLRTSSQETIAFRTLIIATGARVLRLEEFGITGSVAPNICYLRSVQDANKLVEAMAACKSIGGSAVVIGGGYIGMECAAALIGNRIPVTMVFPESHIMARLFTPEIAAFYEQYYEKRGVTFKKGTVMSGFERNDQGKVEAVVLKDGSRLPADLVVVGVGIRPNVSLFEGQLTLEKGGIKVNGKMQTSNSSVYAVGDVVSFPLRMYGEMRKLEHVDHARKSAAHAVQAILCPEKIEDYNYMPYFYSRVFTLSWQFFGDNVGSCIHYGVQSSGKFGAYWINKGKLVGAFLEGGSKDEYAALARVARDRPEVPDVNLLEDQGLGFAMAHTMEPDSASSSFKGSIQAGNMLLEKPAMIVFQAATGIAVAAAIAGFVYWYGSRRRRLL
ncbi:monodehydroascorbate reductase (NADH) [Marchantia polymorpha subsp. ruderalis]|uniref:monodehydroascorbate reductase (NADH) n=2 Tax=Marchantia polymorpha TaxID=3197 RepID=A0AAF6AYI9_MARPO|nr:hypothetical protein MARPO_0006s0270 [Marchantia polymorpha]BBN04823.1 hypothetical protein Mp_3g07930 [Marchantia polymorpha subsp. ruderalis]|eukprot:PTQ48275.1 hypothetical protein MARPO_0006s0270 [Marchantia polymorpha]